MPSTLPAVTLALVALAATASASENLLDPFPSLRSVGDTVYTKFSAVITNVTGNGTKAQVAAAASSASHAVSDAIHAAKSPAGNYTYAAFKAIDTLMYNKTRNGTCNPAAKKPIEVIAIDGSGLLFPYYAGVIQALQDRGVITPETIKTTKFGGLSGGALASVLTALGWSGEKMFAFFGGAVAAIEDCKRTTTDPNPSLACTLNSVGLPRLASMLPQEAAAIVSKRASVWACGVDPTSTTLHNSVAMATSEWSNVDDLIANLRVTDMIPCFAFNGFYNIFRGAPYIDGGYCADYAQLCAKSPKKCLKLSTTFLGPNLDGPEPTTANCDAVTAPNYLPYPGKPYFVPDRAAWTLPQGPCTDTAAKEAVGVSGPNRAVFVQQGTTAKPDIHPAFYAPLPSIFGGGCNWLKSSTGTVPGGAAGFLAMYQHGLASGAGWADAHGYCA